MFPFVVADAPAADAVADYGAASAAPAAVMLLCRLLRLRLLMLTTHW